MYNIVHTYINLFPTVKGSRYIIVTLPTIATIREMKQQNKMSLHDNYISTQTRSSPIYTVFPRERPKLSFSNYRR